MKTNLKKNFIFLLILNIQNYSMKKEELNIQNYQNYSMKKKESNETNESFLKYTFAIKDNNAIYLLDNDKNNNLITYIIHVEKDIAKNEKLPEPEYIESLQQEDINNLFKKIQSLGQPTLIKNNTGEQGDQGSFSIRNCPYDHDNINENLQKIDFKKIDLFGIMITINNLTILIGKKNEFDIEEKDGTKIPIEDEYIEFFLVINKNKNIKNINKFSVFCYQRKKIENTNLKNCRNIFHVEFQITINGITYIIVKKSQEDLENDTFVKQCIGNVSNEFFPDGNKSTLKVLENNKDTLNTNNKIPIEYKNNKEYILKLKDYLKNNEKHIEDVLNHLKQKNKK